MTTTGTTSLNQNRLKELLDYNPDTGVFTWKVSRGSVRAGSVSKATDTYGYTHIKINRRIYRAHRLAFLYMTGNFPEYEVDHINGVPDDNRWVNLRAVAHIENGKNQKKPNDNTSGFIGVCWNKKNRKWYVQINVDGKRKHVGSYVCKMAAVGARRAAELKYGFHENHGRVAA